VANIQSSTPGGTSVTYQYDALNRLSSVIDARLSGSQTTKYGYDAVGNLLTNILPNAVTNLYLYDKLNRLTNLTAKVGNTSLGTFSYSLGPSGNRTNLIETVNGTNRSYAWRYDALYRLTNETVSASPGGSLTYWYDSVGNRTNRSGALASLSAGSSVFNSNDELGSDIYDANGNTKTNAGNQYLYDFENHLINFNNRGAVIYYDGDGNRVHEEADATTTVFLVDTRNPSGYAQVLEELTVNGSTTNLSRAYTYGTSLISQRQPVVSTNFFVFDGHGSTRLLTDPSGNVVNVFTYDAYGTLIASNATSQTVYLYAGQQLDPDLGGLYYNRARYLNVGIGRFWTTDTNEGRQEEPLSLQKYLYGDDNAIDEVDPLGLAPSNGETPSTVLGKAVERVIMDKFTESYGLNAFTARSLRAPLELLGRARLLGGDLLPDLLRLDKKALFEIKPRNVRQIAAGETKLELYIRTLNALDHSGGWHRGGLDEFERCPLSVAVGVPPFFVVVTPPLFGMITYESLDDDVKRKAENVETEEEADIEDTEGIAGLDAGLGGL
jgi:RHS repeat-associated protein